MKDKVKKGSYLIVVALLACFFALMQYFDVFYSIDRKVMDQVYQKQDKGLETIQIIKIDEKTLDALGPFGTWDRSVYGELVKRLSGDYAPSVIAFDITFSGTMSQEGDEAFAKACEEANNVIVANNIITKKTFVTNEITNQSYVDPAYIVSMEQPYDALYKATKQGFADAIFDRDGVIRHALKEVNYEGNTYNSFVKEIYEMYAKKQNIEIQEPSLDEQGRFGFAYSQKADGYEEVSFIDVLNGVVDARIFKDNIVMIGAHAEGMQDAYYTAIEPSKQMYGVEIHANILQAMMQNKTFVHFSSFYLSMMSALFVCVYMLFIRNKKMMVGLISAVVLSVISVFIGIQAFQYGYEMSLIEIPISLGVCYIGTVLYRYLTEVRKRKKIMTVLKRYVAPQVVDEVMKEDGIHMELGGETRDIAVLFVDIRGFTPLSEKLKAHEVVDVLNEYLNLTSSAVFQYKGTLDKFIGDATMAVFNSPFDLDDYVYRAVCTGLAIAKGKENIASISKERYGVEVGFGIGIHCGNAVVGNIGSHFHMDFTAIGDTVNIAARIESQAKSGQVLISEEVKQRLEGRIVVKEIGLVALKGKAEKMMLYEVIDCLKVGKAENEE